MRGLGSGHVACGPMRGSPPEEEGLSLVHRSHDQIPGLSLVPLSTPPERALLCVMCHMSHVTYIIFHSVQVVISHNPAAISLKRLLHSCVYGVYGGIKNRGSNVSSLLHRPFKLTYAFG